MSEGIVRRGDWSGRLADWPRRHRLQLAAGLVFAVTCVLSMSLSLMVFDALVGR